MHPTSFLFACLVAATLLVMHASARASDGGIYLGAGVGQGQIRDDSAGVRFDAKDTSYKGFIGYRFTWLPIIDIAAEAAYTDFRTLKQQNNEYKLHGASGSGLLIFPLGPLDVFGKAGVMQAQSQKNIGGVVTSKTATSGVYGIGAGFRIWKIGVRAEYEFFDVKAVDRAQMYSVSAIFQF